MRNAAKNQIVVPRRSERRFYGHGVPGVDLEQLAGKLIVVEGADARVQSEILAGAAVVQLMAPGTPITYGGIPHIMDPRTSICSFGSPEQALMAVAMVQLGRFYGLPVYINVGLTDSKTSDAQAGMEKGATMVLGALAGADTFGHAGICGADHGGSLAWLVIDDELMAYVKRIVRGFEVDAEALAVEVVNTVGPAGSYLSEGHTVRHFRRELWLPGPTWTRQVWGAWESDGRHTMADRANDRVRQILAANKVKPMEEEMSREIDGIVESARRELG